MRNGNILVRYSMRLRLGSYRTYEEWKPTTRDIASITFLSSYRTYEEWKPHDKDTLPNGQLVLTVPMRNGNTGQSSTYET